MESARERRRHAINTKQKPGREKPRTVHDSGRVRVAARSNISAIFQVKTHICRIILERSLERARGVSKYGDAGPSCCHGDDTCWTPCYFVNLVTLWDEKGPLGNAKRRRADRGGWNQTETNGVEQAAAYAANRTCKGTRNMTLCCYVRETVLCHGLSNCCGLPCNNDNVPGATTRLFSPERRAHQNFIKSLMGNHSIADVS